MKIKLVIASSLMFSSLAQASDVSGTYTSFINDIYQESDVVRAKALELEAELLRANQTSYYFLPKITADSKYKTDPSRGDIFDSKFSANALIYSTSITERFKEKDSKIRGAEISLLKEKENLYKSVVENLIGIKYYTSLDEKANKLERTAINLYNQIEGRYLSGIAKASDVEQARLLIQKIKTESESINKEIELLKANIELSTGIKFPERGIELPNNILNKIDGYHTDEENIRNNLDYKLMNAQALAAKSNAKQQDTLMQVSLVADEKYNNSLRVEKDSYVGVQVTFNIFDYDKKIASKTGMLSYQTLKTKMDFKYKELFAKLRSLQLTSNSNEKELQGLEEQRKTTEMILASQKREYNISQSSYYEMLNTQYDYFALERKISEIKIAYAINKVSLLQVSGELLNL
ncbi:MULTISPECIES: TolC family protein [Citrobacter]|uniref:TolC family protein n=1 Tax=Citrobacter TaxID=544 RepID=UPI000DF0FC51|nr:TolC family protein [Citrobacter braakii]WAD30574.1 TolC family protein [Citrobacter braakii]STA76362.1 Outer membrane efflux protein [Citrobacter freundii]SUX69375.1 Outer membrane efflux protein [Citrobacter freundii]